MKQPKDLRRLTTAALLSALALALSFLEGLLPPLPVPGARLGLANVTVMFALTGVSFPCAAAVTAVKALFALFRGGTAFLMSAAGSGFSLLGMAGLRLLFKNRLGCIGLGVAGAVLHNVGQWCVALLLLGDAMWYYGPVLLMAAIPAGVLTGVVLRVTAPYFKRLSR